MDFIGSYLLLAEREAVWRALNDAKILKQVIPGCHHIAWTGKTTLDLVIKVKLGIANPKFGGELELSEIIPAISYKLSGRGRGGLLGLAHGAARITMRDFELADLASQSCFSLPGKADAPPWPRSGTATHLQFSAQGGASGKIMALGQAVVGNSAQRIIDRFFVRFATAMNTRVRTMPTTSDQT